MRENKQIKIIEPQSSTELKITWSDGETYRIPYIEIRYFCPCASCIDEYTGERRILRSSFSPLIRPLKVQLVGRYALQFHWSDEHDTGIYHYDRLLELCKKQGFLLATPETKAGYAT